VRPTDSRKTGRTEVGVICCVNRKPDSKWPANKPEPFLWMKEEKTVTKDRDETDTKSQKTENLAGPGPEQKKGGQWIILRVEEKEK